MSGLFRERDGNDWCSVLSQFTNSFQSKTAPRGVVFFVSRPKLSRSTIRRANLFLGVSCKCHVAAREGI